MTAVGFAAGESYLPEGPSSPCFHRPVERGLESKFAAQLRELQELAPLAARKIRIGGCAQAAHAPNLKSHDARTPRPSGRRP